MYRVINRYAEIIIDSFKYESEIEPYIKIMQSYNENKIDYNFMAIYKQFYRLNAARLSDSFLNEYFEILKRKSSKDVLEIANKLEKIACNSKNARKVHFSFSTKLMHTMDENSPIYDSAISAFYFLPSIKVEWSIEQKLQSYEKAYHFLKDEYSRIVDKNLLGEALEIFNKKVNGSDKICNIKKIDYLIWQFVSLSKQGKIRDKEIEYG